MRIRRGNSVPPELVIKKSKNEILKKQEVIYFIKKISLLLIVILIIFKTIYGIQVINGQDMYPAIKDGDLAFYFRINASYQIGDVIVFKKGGVKYTSRIVAREGDTVDINEYGEFLVNGNVQQEEIYFLTYPDKEHIQYPYVVGDNAFFVLGDFRTGATDSRYFGEVSKSEIFGKVITLLRRRGF